MQINRSSSDEGLIFNSRWLKVLMITVFILAALIRWDEIKAPGHLLDREYTSAIFSRAYYFLENSKIEDWRREIAVTTKNQQPVLEPPLIEYLVSIIYRVMGREELYYARYLTNAFWLIGGFFMFLIAKQLLSTDEAVVATVYYLFVPMGVIISRSFQPDSLMMMMYLMSLYTLIRYFDAPSLKLLFLSAVVSGMTLLLRPLVIFGIFFAFLSLSIYKNQNWKKILNIPLVIFSIISLLPFVIYYGYSILFAGFMRWKISSSFMPYLLSKKDFWLGWMDNVINVAGFTALVFAMIGFFLIREKKVRYLILGLSASFGIFSVAFTYHIHTHPYYHIQLFPIVGICIAPLIINIINQLKQVAVKFWWVPVISVSIFALFVSFLEVRDSLYHTHAEDPAVAWEIGETIQHSPHTVFVAYYYGLPLEYYGEFGGAPWPVRIEDPFYRRPGEKELSVQERLDGLGFVPDYFVITNFDLYNRKHQDLKEYLESNCEIYAQADQYLIYGSCQNLTSIENKIRYQAHVASVEIV